MSDVNRAGDVNITGGAGGIHGDGAPVNVDGGVGGVSITGGAGGSSQSPLPPPKPSFWFHPVTRTILYIVGAVAAAWIIFALGFKKH